MLRAVSVEYTMASLELCDGIVARKAFSSLRTAYHLHVVHILNSRKDFVALVR